MAYPKTSFTGSITLPTKLRNRNVSKLKRQMKEYGIVSSLNSKGETVYSASSRAGQRFLNQYQTGFKPKIKKPKVKPGYPTR